MNTKRLRTIIPLAVIAVVAVGFATHVGVGTLSAIGWQDISLLCPLGALTTMIATKTMIPRAVISVVIAIALILLFARAFCGWVCPVPVVSKIRGIFSKKTSNTDMTGTGVLPAGENPLVKAAVADGAGAGTEAAAEPAPLSADEQAALKGCGSKAGCSSCAEKRAALDSRHVILGRLAALGGRLRLPRVLPHLSHRTYLRHHRARHAPVRLRRRRLGVILVPALLSAEVVFFRKWCSKLLPHQRPHEPRRQGEPHLRARHRQCEMPRERPGHLLRGVRRRVPPGHQRAPSRGRHELHASAPSAAPAWRPAPPRPSRCPSCPRRCRAHPPWSWRTRGRGDGFVEPARIGRCDRERARAAGPGAAPGKGGGRRRPPCPEP